MSHPLRAPHVVRAIEQAAAAHLGRPWRHVGFTDLNDRASHPCAIFRGEPFSVFAKLATGPDGTEQIVAEAGGLALIRELSGVPTPVPVADGVVMTEAGALLLSEALPERGAGAGLPVETRTPADYAQIGQALARLHRAAGEAFGLTGASGQAVPDGFFGPLRRSNRPVSSGRWADFYAQRRLLPLLQLARDSGHVPPEVLRGVEGIVSRLPGLGGPEPVPALLHGDAQQNNFVSVPGGAVVIDACPYFGHPELDLALVDYFHPVPGDLFRAYAEITPIDAGFAGRRELWRLHGYLAVIGVAGGSTVGRSFLSRLAAAARQYR